MAVFMSGAIPAPKPPPVADGREMEHIARAVVEAVNKRLETGRRSPVQIDASTELREWAEAAHQL